MKKALIHQTPEERLANASRDTLSETQRTNQLLEELRAKEQPTKMQMELVNKPNDLATAFFSMLKGEKGDTPTKEELLALIKPLIPKRGKPGKQGEPGRNPITVSKNMPKNPQIGDLWYRP